MMKSAAVLVLLTLGLVGCSRQEPAAAKPAADQGHLHAAPNGGQLVELGDHQFNLEFKYDAARGMLQAWVLDGHAENFVRVGMTLFDVQEVGGQQRTISLRAVGNAMTGETAGDTSAFEGEAPWLGGIGHFDGVVKAIKVRETVFRDVTFHFHPQG
jgi:hypothetical protein